MTKIDGSEIFAVGRKVGDAAMAREGEYVHSPDGLIYCAKCNTPKEFLLKEAGRFMGIPCKCRQAEINAWNADFEREQNIARIAKMRERGLRTNQQQCAFGLDDGADPETTRVAKNYVKNFDKLSQSGQGLLFWGSVGTGKTFTALCIANALIDAGVSVLATNLAEVVAEAQDWDNAEDNANRRLQFKAIVIDDFGTERETTFAKEQIYNYVDACYQRKIPLIVTTNYTPSKLQETADDKGDLTNARICSRILERCFPVKVNTAKRRLAKQGENKVWVAEMLGLRDD
jgi:DNA replication protein DnaC